MKSQNKSWIPLKLWNIHPYILKNCRLFYITSWSNWGEPTHFKWPCKPRPQAFAATANRKDQNTFASCHHHHHHPPPPPWWSDEKSKSAPSKCQTWKVSRGNHILLDHLWKQLKRAALKNYFAKNNTLKGKLQFSSFMIWISCVFIPDTSTGLAGECSNYRL